MPRTSLKPGKKIAIRFMHLFIYGISVFLFFTSCQLNAQSVISGRILNNTSQPVTSASVTISDSLNGNILAYSISNTKGEYKIEITSALKQFIL
jgi:hypothetical protein